MANETMHYAGKNVVSTIRYAPNGTDHELQRVITNLLHQIVMEDGRFTLAELGYLHMNTLTYEKDTSQLHLRVYFDARFAARVKEDSVNRSRKIQPVKELEVFKNYLYVGNIFEVLSFTKVLAPKGKAVEDELHRPALKFKDDAKLIETDALVLECNLPITIAAAHDISLQDENFDIKCTTVGKGGKNAIKSIVASSSKTEVPVELSVTSSTNRAGFDPNDSVPYLTALADKMRAARKNQEKLSNKVRSDAKNAAKSERSKATNKNFNKYS